MDIEQTFIKDVDDLVPRPDIALEVMSLAHSQKSSIKELAGKIEQDPSLTANMLRISNSAYFGQMKKINSIHDIIVRLGIDTVRMLAITGAAVGFLKTPQGAYNLEPGALWKHSYATALLSSILCRYADVNNVPVIYSAALLHDIGKIILNKALQDECVKRDVFWDGRDIAAFEKDLLGTDHIKVGAALLKKWGLSEAIIQPVLFHHSPAVIKSEDMDSKIVYLANSLAESIGISAVEPEECIGAIKERDLDEELASMPGLQDNMENIIEEFFNKFNN